MAHNQNGIVLIMVMWILTILMVVVFAFSAMTRTDTYATLSFKEGVESKFIAEAGIERGIMELLYRKQNPSPDVVLEGTEPWKVDGTYYYAETGTGEYRARLLSESGKVDLNKATTDILINLLTTLGIKGKDDEEPAALVDAMMDWRDADDLVRLNGAEDAYYMSLPNPYKPKNADFDTIDELLLVKGFTKEILYGDGEKRGLADFITVYSGSGQINVNAAPKEVLTAVPGITADIADIIIEYRKTKEIKALNEVDAANFSRYLMTEDGNSAYTIEAEGKKARNNAGYAIRAIVTLEGNKYKYIYYKNPEEIRPWKAQQ
ncbi:MAG: general secretion pathway protein GspK [Nitrospirota bacterium]